MVVAGCVGTAFLFVFWVAFGFWLVFRLLWEGGWLVVFHFSSWVDFGFFGLWVEAVG